MRAAAAAAAEDTSMLAAQVEHLQAEVARKKVKCTFYTFCN